jgi:hypothetical protein
LPALANGSAVFDFVGEALELAKTVCSLPLGPAFRYALYGAFAMSFVTRALAAPTVRRQSKLHGKFIATGH